MEKQHTEDELRLSGLAAEAARHRRDRQRLEGRLEAAQAGRSDLVGLVEALRQGMEQTEAAGVQAHARMHMVCRHEYMIPSKLPWCPPYPIMPLIFSHTSPYLSILLNTSPRHLALCPPSPSHPPSQALCSTGEELLHGRGQVDLLAGQLRLASDAAAQRSDAWLQEREMWQQEREEVDAKQATADVLVEVSAWLLFSMHAWPPSTRVL